MKEWNRERVELHMLISLARSQRALCRIIESVADHMEGSDQLSWPCRGKSKVDK